MNLEQTGVRHVRYGQGTVVSCTDGLIKVAFEAGEKQFVYPDAFERFLRAEDPTAAACIAEAIILKKAEEDAIRREQEAAHQAALAVLQEKKPARRTKKTK